MIDRREPSREEIARHAHELYLERGGEHGKDVEDWVRAERELRGEPWLSDGRLLPSRLEPTDLFVRRVRLKSPP